MRSLLVTAAALAACAFAAVEADAASVRIVLVPGAGASATLVAPDGARATASAGRASRRLDVRAGVALRVESGVARLTRTATSAPRQTWIVARIGGRLRIVRLVDPATATAGPRQVRVVAATAALAGARVGIHRSAAPLERLVPGAATAYLGAPATPAVCADLAMLDIRLRGAVAGLPRLALPERSATAIVYAYDPRAMYPFSIVVVGDGAAAGVAPPAFVDDPATIAREPVAVAPGVRVFDALPGVGAVVVTVGDRAAPLVYGQATRHLRVGVGAHRVVVARGPRILARGVVRTSAADPSATVVLAPGDAGGVRVAAFRDAPPADVANARLRVLHAQPLAGRLDLDVVGGSALARGLRPLRATPYEPIDDALARPCMGAAHVDIRRAGRVIKRSVLTLDPGNAYTAFAIRPHRSPPGAVKLVIVRDGR